MRPDARRRAGTMLYEPNAWTVGVLLTTSVLVMARHPIARAIGTEVPAVPTVTAAAPPRSHPLAQTPSLTMPVVAVPTHAPRDPFRALVTAGGKVLAPADLNTKPAAAPSVLPAATAATAATATCTGTTHRVVAGDTLWTLAARAVGSSATGRVTVAWHRLYDANRAVVGADPAVLRVGATLCVPESL